MAIKLITFNTDTDGPLRPVYINPEVVAFVDSDMVNPEKIGHISLITGHQYRVMEPARIIKARLESAI